jgi:hypothetical protein
MGIKCFLIEPTQNTVRHLRRYSNNNGCSGSYHNADVFFDIRPSSEHRLHELLDKSDPRWGAVSKCQKCGYAFADSDEWQMFCQDQYRRVDTGELTTLREAAVGAMWYADWMTRGDRQGWSYRGPDGRCLVVRTPGGDWMVEQRASNCTMPDDNEHRCWVRHGAPPVVTVNKAGHTCAAGAGSIQCGSYHGFLTNGELT